jgi:hypothetical protein
MEEVGGRDKPSHRPTNPAFTDTGDYMASVALLTDFGNGKSPSPRAKGD